MNLKPCPFCGSNGYQATHRVTDTRGAFLCHACNARGPEDEYDPFKRGAGVIAARWNRRTPSPAVQALVRAAEDMLASDAYRGELRRALAAVEKEMGS